MARAVLGDDSPRRTGAFTLRPAQRDAVRAAERALAEHGGALIADAPGAGKTVLALSVAAGYDDVLILVPAALREQWKRAATRADVEARIESIESLSHGASPRPATLIIVDEAHHLRTPTTVRYRKLAELAVGRRLLLLTATPVVNSRRDRDALLALFLGERASRLTESARAAVMLRLASAASPRVDVKALPPLAAASDVPGLAGALQRLPPPLPVVDGAEATAIVRLTLAFAWASSLAALDSALRRRIERGRNLDAELAAGRWPSRDALRAWVLGDDATQLALGFDIPSGSPPPAGARSVLAAHLEAVMQVRALIAPHIQRDTLARAAALKALLAQQSPRRTVVLAQSAVTVRALYAALKAAAGVVAITGTRVHAAAGRWSRDEVLRALDATARPYDARDLRGIRLLLATDILAEGVELQAASVLVHGDLAWTPARLDQRVGRLAREGQRERVLVTQFAIPNAANAMLQIHQRLRRKSVAGVSALGASNSEAALRRRLTELLRDGDGDSHTRVAAVRGPRCGFVALVRQEGRSRLLAASHDDGAWRIRESPTALLDLLPSDDAEPVAFTAAQVTRVRRLLRNWHHRRLAASLVAGRDALPEATLRALRRRLDASVAAAPLCERMQRAQEVSEMLSLISAFRGSGAERMIKQLLASDTEDARFIERLRELTREGKMQKRPAPHAGAGRLIIEALLILAPAPRASEESGPALP